MAGPPVRWSTVLGGKDALIEFAGTQVPLHKEVPLDEQLKLMRRWAREDDSGGIDLSRQARDQLNQQIIEVSGRLFHDRYQLPPGYND
jgi:hypothetical protein